MKRKNIVIGIILLSMLLLAACGEEKPLADRVIENLEDCMGAREMTEEEYEEIKRKKILYPVDYKIYMGQKNIYLLFKEEDLENANDDLSYFVNEDIEVSNALIYKYENHIDDKITEMTVQLYEFTDDDSVLYKKYIKDVWERYYEDAKFDNMSPQILSKEKKLGKTEGEKYIYQFVKIEETKGIGEVYCFWDGSQVIEICFNGYEDNELYPKFKKFLKKMKFEGLNDIKLEYAEPQSGDE